MGDLQRLLRAVAAGLVAGPLLGAGALLWSGGTVKVWQIGYTLVMWGVAAVALIMSTYR